jgi:hypothetical protein
VAQIAPAPASQRKACKEGNENVLFVEVDAVVVLTTSVTATTFVLPVLTDTPTSVTDVTLQWTTSWHEYTHTHTHMELCIAVHKLSRIAHTNDGGPQKI